MSNKLLERVKELFDYDPLTGAFVWRISTNSRSRVGEEAGSVGEHTEGYRRLWVDGRPQAAHRVAWLFVHGVLPAGQIDHINGDRSDNRIANLRVCTPAQNAQNRKVNVRNKSGHPGVVWHRRDRKWQASIKINDRMVHLGYFAELGQAISAYNAGKAAHHTFQPTQRLGERP